MKFRCERDTLAEAVATAQRAVASRTGAMPVLSGLRCLGHGHRLELVGTDLELTIRVRVPAEGDGEGSAVLPGAAVLRDRAPARRRHRDGRARRRRRPDRGRPLRDDVAHAVGGRVPAAARVGARPAYGSTPRAFAEALRQVVPGASRDDARPILTGVLLTASAGGLRLVATDSYRLALRDLQGVSMLDEGQKVLVAAKGLGEVQRLLSSATARSRWCSASARSCSGSAPPRSPPG